MSRFFTLTYWIANLGLVLYGALTLASPSQLLHSFSLNVYAFPSPATLATAYLAALFRLLGFFNLVLGVVGILLLLRLRTAPSQWVARTLIVSTTLAYVGPVVFDNTVGQIGGFELLEHAILLAALVAGLLQWGKTPTAGKLTAQAS